MNLSNFTVDEDTDMRVGFNVGVQPSLMFTQKSAKDDIFKYNSMYMELLVMAAALLKK